MDDDKILDELENLDGELDSDEIRHLKLNQRLKFAENRAVDPTKLPTAKKKEIAETAEEIDDDLRSEADALAKYEEEERWDNQRERQIKRLEDEGSDPDDESD